VAGSTGEGPIVIVGGGAAAAFLLHQLAVADGPARPVVVVDPGRAVDVDAAPSLPLEQAAAPSAATTNNAGTKVRRRMRSPWTVATGRRP